MSDQLDLMPMRPSMARPQEPIARAATIEGCYRWDLSRAWGSGGAVCWVMLNPSTADGVTDDPTIRNIMCRSARWGFGSLVVVNIYPYRSCSPTALKRWLRDETRGSKAALGDNAEFAFARMRKADLVMAAWGAHAVHCDVAWLLEQHLVEPELWGRKPIALHCLGLTKSGAPLHPLARGKHFIPMDRRPIPFEVLGG